MVKSSINQTRSKLNNIDSNSESGSEYETENDNNNEIFDQEEFTKLLGTLFPSKYLNEKIKNEKPKNEKPKKKKYIKSNKKAISSEHDLTNNDSNSDSNDSNSNSDSDSDSDYDPSNPKQNINISFTIDEEYVSDEEYETYSEDENAAEDILINMSKLANTELDSEADILNILRETTKGYKTKHPKSPILQDLDNFSKTQEKKIKKKYSKSKRSNTELFKKLISDKSNKNELSYFYNLPIKDQKNTILSIRDLKKTNVINKPYRFKILELDIPNNLKIIALRKVNTLRNMEPSSSEYYKIHNWMNTFLRIPFNTYKSINTNIKDGVDKCGLYIDNAIKTLDDAAYGLTDAKLQILQVLGNWVSNPDAIGNAIAIKGPPGTGKTTLVKEGISKILERPFEFIALGGSTDSSFLEGHSYTYEGSTWGKIVSTLIKCKCMNPIIYFDELDKVSETPKGDEIIGILTHLIDTSQNNQFHDKYFADIDFDLSKCLFIFSYNNEEKINPILKDRMYKIQTNGYSTKDKINIVNDYLLPKIMDQVKFQKEDIIISDDIITHIINTYTNEEKGVRNLKRCIEILYTKVNLFRLTKTSKSPFIKEQLIDDIQFPLTVTTQLVDKLMIKKEVNLALASLYS